jgi:hypothetical protein
VAKIDSQKVIRHLQEKWGSRPCPMCSKGPWGVQDSMFQLMEFSEGALTLGGPLIPVVPVVCKNCGYLVLVSALAANVVPPPPPAKVEGSK